MTFLGIRVKSVRAYTLTIQYISNSTEIAPRYTSTLPVGATYSVPSPEIEGYILPNNYQVISGTMPARDVIKQVHYLSD